MAETQSAANLLRNLRREQGRSLRTAAADIGVAPSQLSRLERGKRGLADGMPEKLASYYGVPAEIIALAQGEVPADVVAILQQHPEILQQIRSAYEAAPAPDGLRVVSDLPDERGAPSDD